MTDIRPAFPSGTILGYPRIGRRRELKRAVEAFWAGTIDEAELEATAAGLRRSTRARLVELGLGRNDSAIPESFSYYDQVLDAAVTAGILPERFAHLRAEDGSIGLGALFTAARGAGDAGPLEMTKWFDTNYHYLVPEIGPETAFALSSDRFARQVAEARADGYTTRPVVVGPRRPAGRSGRSTARTPSRARSRGRGSGSSCRTTWSSPAGRLRPRPALR